jgi:hypothetical protein
MAHLTLQLDPIMAEHVDDDQSPAGLEHACRFAQHGRRVG